MVSIHQEMQRSTCVTYRPTLTVSILTNPQHIPMNIGNDGVRIHDKFSLGRGQLVAVKQWRTEHTLKT